MGAIAETLGVAETTVSVWLNEPASVARFEAIQERGAKRAAAIIEAHTVEAVERAIEVMRGNVDFRAAGPILKACTAILDRGGLPPASKVEHDIRSSDPEITDEELVKRLAELAGDGPAIT